MPSLHRRPRSPFWYVSYQDASGVWRLRSTGERERRLAQKLADRLDDAARLARKGELTRVAAIKMMSEMVEVSTGERLNDPTAREFLTQWLASKGGTRSSSTAARYRPAINAFLEILATRADRSLRGITATDLEHFRSRSLDQGKTNGSANMDVKIVSIALDAAKKQGIISYNPATALESLPADEERRQPFSEEQVKKLLAAAEDDWKGMILFGVLAGTRLTDAANLTWEDIDLAAGQLTFTPRKTKRSRKTLSVALHPSLISWLEARAGSDEPRAPLFPDLAGKGAGSDAGLSNSFSRLMIRAGVNVAQTRTGRGKGRGFSPLSYHSCRHTFVSALMNGDVPQDVRKAIAGHSCDRAHERYSHLALETQRRAVQKLPSYG